MTPTASGPDPAAPPARTSSTSRRASTDRTTTDRTTTDRITTDRTARRGGVARSVLRGAGVILLVTVFARIAGFVRYLVFGASVGAGDVGTAYSTANMLPNVLFEVVAGGVLAAVVVPLIAGLVPEGDPEDHVGPTTTADPRQVENLRAEEKARPVAEGAALADRIVSSLLTWTLLGTGVLAALVIFCATPLAQLLLAADSPGAAGVPLGASLLRIFAFQLPLYGLSCSPPTCRRAGASCGLR